MLFPLRCSLVTLLLALAPTALRAQHRIFTAQYSFGDSLSDNGNLFAVSSRTLPAAPYFQGRFSNGLVFTELLGRTLVPHTTPGAAQRGDLNFAYGGATAAPGSQVPHLAQQVALYRAQGLPALRTDLFTVLAGANDLFPVLAASTTPSNPAALDAAAASAAASAAGAVQSLVSLGAKNIVAAGLPGIGASPRALAAGATGVALGERATTAFNGDFRARLAAIAAATPDVNIVYVDLAAILARTVSDFRALGYVNVTTAYLAPSAAGGGSGSPDGYVFWDDIHPTAKTHALLAAIVTEQLNPEIPLGFATGLGRAALVLQATATDAVEVRTRKLAGSGRARGRIEGFAGYDYLDGGRGPAIGVPSFEFTGSVATAGVDARAGESLMLGGAVQTGKLDFDAERGSFTLVDSGARVFAVWTGSPVSLALDAGCGVLSVRDLARVTAFGGLPARGKTGGERFGAGVKAMWSLAIGKATLRPWLTLRTERVRLDGFSERDLPALAMSYESQKATTSAGALGVEASIPQLLSFRRLRLDLRGSWHGELISRSRTVAGKLVDNFTLRSALAIEDGDSDGAEFGAAFALALSPALETALGYVTEVRSGDRTGHRVTFTIQSGF